jgi:hypothetical protein
LVIKNYEIDQQFGFIVKMVKIATFDFANPNKEKINFQNFAPEKIRVIFLDFFSIGLS